MRPLLDQNQPTHRLWLSVGFLILFLLACGINFTSVTLFVSGFAPSPTPIIPSPAPTSSQLVDTTASISTVVNDYYRALQAKNYEQAFTFFAENSTITTQTGTKPISKDILKQLNTQQGDIESFSPEMIYAPSKDDIRVAQLIVKHHNHQKHTVNITLDQEAEGWKITDIDGI